MDNFKEIKEAALQLGYAMAAFDAFKFVNTLSGDKAIGADLLSKHLDIKLENLKQISNEVLKEAVK